MSAEHWKSVPGFEGIYDVSDLGNIRSLDRVNRRGARLRGKDLRLIPANDRGYRKVVLYDGPTRKQALVHRLVLEAFVGPCPDGLEACHGDGNTTNNELANLRWDSSSANNFDIVEHGHHVHASKEACKRGHPYVAGNLAASPRAHWRRCRACSREGDRARTQSRPFDQVSADAIFAELTRSAA